MAETIKIGGELESMATGGVVAAASAIKDKVKDKYQSEVNQEVDQALADRYPKNVVYTKEQTDAKIEAQIVDVTTREKYDTFSATNEDVSIDTILPPVGLEDTIYRVANWDGTEYNTSYWSQYAWKQDTENTGHYVRLAVKNQGLDTTPTPNSLNPVSSGGVADACGHLEEHPEYLKVEVDGERKITHSVSKKDGAYWFHKLKSPTLDAMQQSTDELVDYVKEEHPFTNKKISIIGDSISTFEGYIPDGYPSWYPHQDDRSSDVISVNDTWWKKLIDTTDSELEVNASWSGSRASKLQDVPDFCDRVNIIGNPDIIFIELGTNDSRNDVEIGEIDFNAESYDLTKFAPAYVKGIKDTIYLYPNSIIVCIIFDMGEDYKDVIKNVAEHYNIPCIDVSEISDIHPNKAEMQVAYEKIYNDTNKLSVWVNAKINISTRQNEKDLAAHYDYYNVSKHHSVRDVVDVYTANDGWEQVEYDSSFAPYDELDIYQIGEKCNFGGDTEHSYEATISQRGVVPATVTQEYETRTKFTLEEALAVLPAAVISAFAAGQKICFADLDDFIEEWQITEGGTWERISPYDIKDPEGRIEIRLGADNKIVAYRKANGTWVECVGIEAPNINLDNYVEKEEGKGLIDTGFAESQSTIEDPEGRLHLELDEKGKIMDSVEGDGSYEHNTKHVFNGGVEFNEQTMTEFQQALKNSGFNPGGGSDWTDKSSMQISIPRLAFVNIIAPNGNAVWPISKTNDYHYYMEFYDGAGNYFKKEIIFNAQGRSSMNFAKKNGAVDICNNNGWDDDDTFKIKFGEWVPQDSFHFKAYYTDFFRGINVIAYKMMANIWKSRGIYKDKPYKRILLPTPEDIGYSHDTMIAEIDDTSLQIDNGARCIPDGFPAIFYLNGEFYGIYSWQLKKHRDNYHMKKNNGKHIHLDGNINNSKLFGANGDIDNIDFDPSAWAGFEIRNPKDIWTTEGEKYDADIEERQVPVDSATAEQWIEAGVLPDGTAITSKIAKQLRYTAKVRQYILTLSTYIPTLQGMRTGGSSDADIRAKIEEYFDVDSLIDYILFSSVSDNWDGFSANWQWTTWDGVKWAICPYDMDSIFGAMEQGNVVRNYTANKFANTNRDLPSGWVTTYYQAELKARWDELVQKELITSDTFVGHLMSWLDRIGENNFEKEYEKWATTPCNRDSNENAEFWHYNGNVQSSGWTPPAGTPVWDANTNYSEDDVAWFKCGRWYQFTAVTSNTGEQPIKDADRYTDGSPALGFRDSIYRVINTYNYHYNTFNEYISSLNI